MKRCKSSNKKYGKVAPIILCINDKFYSFYGDPLKSTNFLSFAKLTKTWYWFVISRNLSC